MTIDLHIALMDSYECQADIMWHIAKPTLCDTLPQADHLGVTFNIQYMPQVTSIFPSTSGTSGSDLVTLTGESFTVTASAAKVYLSGTPCNVVFASMYQIVCELLPHREAVKGFTMAGQVVYPGMLVFCLCHLRWYTLLLSVINKHMLLLVFCEVVLALIHQWFRN